jgi:hypothetical protein
MDHISRIDRFLEATSCEIFDLFKNKRFNPLNLERPYDVLLCLPPKRRPLGVTPHAHQLLQSIGEREEDWDTISAIQIHGTEFKVVQRAKQIQRRLIIYTGLDMFNRSIAMSLGFITDIVKAKIQTNNVADGTILICVTWYESPYAVNQPFDRSNEACAYLYSRRLGGHILCRLDQLQMRQATFYPWSVADQLVIAV